MCECRWSCEGFTQTGLNLPCFSSSKSLVAHHIILLVCILLMCRSMKVFFINEIFPHMMARALLDNNVYSHAVTLDA